MNKITLLSLTPSSKNFYQMMGQFAMDKSIVKEFDGYPITTEQDWNWLIAMDKDKPVGFLSYKLDEESADLKFLYTTPSLRRKGVCSKLYAQFKKETKKSALSATATKDGKAFLEKQGWSVEKPFVKWYKMSA